MSYLRKNWPALTIAALAVAFLAIGVVRIEEVDLLVQRFLKMISLICSVFIFSLPRKGK